MIEVTPTLTLDVRPVSTKEYNIISLRGSKQKEAILHTDDKPITKYSKTNSGGKVLKYLDKKLSESIVKNIMQDDSSYEIGTTISEYKEDYIQNILSELEKIRQRVCGNVKEETEAKYDETILIKDLRLLIKMGKKYPNLWQDFQARCKSLQYTPLQFISKVTDGLGVGLTVEVIRAFFGYLQTYLGYKGTNVIAIGSQSSGKSHIIETALKFMPQEYVHMGVKSVAYFFRKYNHQDLTGHIFYLGDLGGDNDNENTIQMRDILKQLSTDGYIERGVVDDEKNSEEQWVKGYPCLTYTTAHEGMINEQERSRSIIITPPDVAPDKLLTFKSILNNQGAYKQELFKVQRDCESIKGLVEYLKNVKKEVDIFNPFLYDIGDFIGDIEDFNRKIDEFNSILKLSCILNKSKVIMHQQYNEESPLILASKQDVRNALAIFDNTVNLLPNEVKLINGILKNFEAFGISNDFSSVAEYEDYIKNQVGTLEGSNIPDWLSENTEEHSIFFNERYLRSKCGNQRWIRTNSPDLHQKLSKLYQQEYLIQIGYNSKDDPVYAINGMKYKNAQKVNYVSPSFKSSNLKRSCALFHENYPCSVDEYKEFLENLPPVRSSDEVFFEELSKEDPIYNLGWLT